MQIEFELPFWTLDKLVNKYLFTSPWLAEITEAVERIKRLQRLQVWFTKVEKPERFIVFC